MTLLKSMRMCFKGFEKRISMVQLFYPSQLIKKLEFILTKNHN